MCGIAGALIFNDSSFRVDQDYLERMARTIVHRGPDGEGTWIARDGRIGLAFRRLAIIDLSHAADQPMRNSDSSVALVFNGEIYNHAELRRELEATGKYDWQTDHSDTEVILHAYEEWGIDALDRLRGMFAIAIWDDRQNKLWLVRDRLGIKPLYYSIHHGRITFASEIKALLTDSQQERAVDEDALFHYLSFLTTPAPMTLFAGIRKLAAGTRLCVDLDGEVNEQRWYEVWDHVHPQPDVRSDAAAKQVLEKLRESVRLRKVSDVPVGVFLSGGIDSSTNAALFAEDADEPIKTFTIGYQGEHASYSNETGFARTAARHVGADHHELLLDQDHLIDFLPTMTWLQDEPIADPVCVPVYYVSKLARDAGVIVCQVGEGADELFCGYPSWKRYLRLQSLNDNRLALKPLRRALLGAVRTARRGDGFPAEWLRRGVAGVPIFWGGAEAFTDAQKHRLLSPRLQKRFAGRTSWEALAPIRERFEEKAWEPSGLHWMSYLDLTLRLPELLLMRVDKMSMGTSLEGRVPFLDHEFVELVLGLPQDLKTEGGELKTILKRAVRGIIPDDIIDRPKQGFGVPVHEWMLDRLGKQAEEVLEEFCRETDFLDWGETQRVLKEVGGAQAWYLFNLALWWKRFIAVPPEPIESGAGPATEQPRVG